MSDGLITLTSLPELRGMDGAEVQEACMLCYALVAHISLGLPDMTDSRQQSLIRTNYGEGQLAKIYGKFRKIGSFIVFSHKLMSKELVPSNNE